MLGRIIAALLLWCSLPAACLAATVAEIARLQGHGETILQGPGLVIGLNGTGDSGKELAMARPLAEVLKSNGNPVLIDELKNVKTVALVMVTCVIPEGGARTHDKFDVRIAAINSATSLAGGTLYLAPLTGPFPKISQDVYAIAEGEVTTESPTSPRTGRVRGGARIVQDILPDRLGSTFTLILRPPFAGWASADAVASAISDEVYKRTSLSGLPRIASVIDERTIRIDIPEWERKAPAAFIADVLSTPVNVHLLKLPAQVIYNREAGAIILTGDVEISPVAITQRDLTITTTIPAPEPTPINPLVETRRWAALGAGDRSGDRAKLQDLLDAFNQLKIPVSEQIAILSMLEKTGKLHARLIID
jgi:flagellar P-ring protein FlgI